MPEILVEKLRQHGHTNVLAVVEDPRSKQPIAIGAFGNFAIRNMIEDLSVDGHHMLNSFLIAREKNDLSQITYAHHYLQGIKITSDKDPRFKEHLQAAYYKLYKAYIELQAVREEYINVLSKVDSGLSVIDAELAKTNLALFKKDH